MTIKRLKPALLYVLQQNNVVDPKVEAARWGIGLHVAEQACEELCTEGKMQRGQQVSELIRGLHYFVYINNNQLQ